MKTWTLTIHALTPLHPGTGRGVGLIDLPVARERATEHPLVPGSSIKGVFRDACRRDESHRADVDELFGPEPANAAKQAGALRFSDSRVVLFPVQSDRGTFAWITCPWVLARLARDLPGMPGGLPRVAEGKAVVPEGSVLIEGTGAKKVVLDGLDIELMPDTRQREPAGKWADALAGLVFPKNSGWRDMLRSRFCVVDDDSFTWFVRQATEVRARIRIDENTGTVAKGALWYQEMLPAETVLVGIVQHVPVGKGSDADAEKVLGTLANKPLQLGGDAGVGLGMVRTTLHAHGGQA